MHHVMVLTRLQLDPRLNCVKGVGYDAAGCAGEDARGEVYACCCGAIVATGFQVLPGEIQCAEALLALFVEKDVESRVGGVADSGGAEAGEESS